MNRRPPLAARFLVRLALRGDAGDVVRGDLDEDFHDALAGGAAPRAARRRYWRQALASVASVHRDQGARASRFAPRRSTLRAGLLNDVRFVVRRLRATPGFTAVAALSLAIGIGANTAIASMARAALFESLPVEHPDQLWFLFWGPRLDSLDGMYMDGDTDPATGQHIISNVSYPAYQELRAAAAETASIGGFTFIRKVNVVAGAQPAESAGAILADGSFFSVLHPPMALGRGLTVADDRPGAEPVAVIGYEFWQRIAGGSLSVLDLPVTVNGVPMHIVGVTGRGFSGLSPGGFRPKTDITMPLSLQPRLAPSWTPASGSLFTRPRTQWVRVLVRIPPGVSPASFEARATSALRVHLAAAGLADAATAGAAHAVLRPAGRGINLDDATTRRSIAILSAVVGVVLLIACLNLAGLMLARGVARQREFIVRTALGATRSQLVRLAFIESLALAISGGVLGTALLFVGRELLAALVLEGLGPVVGHVAVDARILGMTFGVSLVAAVIAGVLPAVEWSGLQMLAGLAQRPGGNTPPRLRIGRALLAIQIGVSIPLLCGAGLLLRTMQNLTHVDLGFSPASLATFRVEAPGAAPGGDVADVYQRILDRLASVPGIQSASMAENPLISGVSSSRTALVDGRRRSLYVNAVGPRFFESLGVPVLEGRGLEPRDAIGPEKVVLNRTAAERLFGGAALGRRFVIPAPPGTDGDREVEVVGVVGDTKYTSVRAPVPPTMFDYFARRPSGGLIGMTFMARAAGPPAALEQPIREAVAGVARGVAVTEFRTETEQIDRTIGRERVFTRLLTLFAAFSLLLASMGLYGTTAYSVARRTSEIGVRLALGAGRAQVLWLMLRQSAVLALIGLSVGIPAALAAGSFLKAMLFGLAANDPATLAESAAVMFAVVLVAGWLPARKASRIDPLAAIRTD